MIEDKFTFEDVKSLLDSLLTQDKKKLEYSINSGLKQLDFNQANLAGHSVESCQELLDKLVDRTRRVRTTEEVLQDIRDNLNRRTYTDIIQRYGMAKQAPKRPPSSYFLFHKERFPKLKNQLEKEYEEWAKANPGSQAKKPPRAKVVAVRVSQEWKEMSPTKRAQYQKIRDDLMKRYVKDMKKLGLNKLIKPKRPKSAKIMYIEARLAELDKLPSQKSKLDKLKQKFGEEFDKADLEVKNHFISLSKEELDQYREELIKYCEENPHLDRNEIIKERKKAVKVVPPAQPRNPCRIYIDKKLPDDLEGQELKDEEARLREKFNRLSVKKQLKYIKKAIREKEKYEEKLAEFTAEHPNLPLPNQRPNLSKQQWILYQTHVENRPPQPASSAYLYYCSKCMSSPNNGYEKPTKRLQSASAAWTALSQSEKAQVYSEHIEAIKQYIEDMEDWLADKDEKRVERIFREDPKCPPEVWRRRLAKLERALAKKEFD